ncbi:conserved hypothetical protein [Methylorubrum populi BJ001]|jgi:hypothetical protein|uniref:Uncharacterized protein n=1 Tax=Methylorubrum populi (strain ATCC BAA-705 / NCIMB 13946 / BJ001) TaxID=441620 RepID=B1ZKC2_METPB|nr:hypothetical protein [Methylorubrum populi]ACB80114.1 conserved hypothetical protein [Methylorubrum populi BJ001]OAH17110.1 hypothetical protein AX289_08380 [Methylorubrum populi]PZP68468.1 MAG: hypothetical protein DI590_17145 [Methylorubrum populi]
MTNPFDIKNRFRARLRAADAQKHRVRAKLLQDGTRALSPIIEALNLMAEVLEEDGIEHGRILCPAPEVDRDDFVGFTATLQNGVDQEHRITVKYGPVLGGRNFIAVTGLGAEYNERLLALATNAAPSLGRSVGNDVHVEADRGGDLAEILREMVEDFFAGHSEPPIRTGPTETRGRLALVQ